GLDHLKELGVTALELMPVAQFPGDRNWGYDGVYPYAPQNTYGGPSGLKSLVNACHRKGLAVILDVVYNHLGPDGNYLSDFGPYFTSRYKTPWGDAVNYDGAYSDEVRAFFIQNALYWISEFHFDGLRLDAIDAIYDLSARHVLAELADAVHRRAGELGRQAFVVAESDLNDVKLINPSALGGYGIDAQWSDDFHHALHALLTHERKGYYQDFGGIEHLKKAFQEGFVYSGSYSQYRKRRHGNSSRGVPARQFIVCSQNHDQIGNRMLGERLSSIISFEQQKLAAGCVLLSPFIPLLFMGEEYGEHAPFLYFVSHLDDQLVKAVREGRSLEFAHFEWDGTVPDPQDESTFLRSKIEPSLSREGRHRTLFLYYRELIQLRKALPALSAPEKNGLQAVKHEQEQVLIVRQGRPEDQILLLLNFRDRTATLPVLMAPGLWTRMLDSSSAEWDGPCEHLGQTIRSAGGDVTLTLNAHSVVVYTFAGEERK
ncbi:MAG: malto-oligosyltrehalose trehalohydrolase, partial [Nitrospirae bacterium GWC2_57_9]